MVTHSGAVSALVEALVSRFVARRVTLRARLLRRYGFGHAGARLWLSLHWRPYLYRRKRIRLRPRLLPFPPLVKGCALPRLVLPAVRRHDDGPVQDDRRPTVVDGRVHYAHVAVVPVEISEEEVDRKIDRPPPPEADRYARTVGARVARPRRPHDGLVCRPPPRPIDDPWVVVGHVDHLRIERLNGERTRSLHNNQSFIGGKLACRACPPAQLLHRIHDVRFLCEECLAEPARPVRILVHAREQLRERDQRLHARVPVFVLHRAHRIVALQARIGARPARRCGHLERIGRGHQHLREQRIGIQRDRR